jgi:hypothetical protein
MAEPLICQVGLTESVAGVVAKSVRFNRIAKHSSVQFAVAVAVKVARYNVSSLPAFAQFQNLGVAFSRYDKFVYDFAVGRT